MPASDGISIHLNQFVRNRERTNGVVTDSWAFAGSAFYARDGKELYAADSAGGVIGLTGKGAAVIQYAQRVGIPYQGEDQGLECNEPAIPPVGTTVRVIMASAVPIAPPTDAIVGDRAPGNPEP